MYKNKNPYTKGEEYAHIKPTASIFGQPPEPAPAPASGFGAPASTSGFGAPAPASGFGQPAPASGFGAPAPASGFGALAPASTSGFGQLKQRENPSTRYRQNPKHDKRGKEKHKKRQEDIPRVTSKYPLKQTDLVVAPTVDEQIVTARVSICQRCQKRLVMPPPFDNSKNYTICCVYCDGPDCTKHSQECNCRNNYCINNCGRKSKPQSDYHCMDRCCLTCTGTDGPHTTECELYKFVFNLRTDFTDIKNEN